MAGEGPSRTNKPILLALMMRFVLGLHSLSVAVISGNDCFSGAVEHRCGGTRSTASGVREEGG